MKRKGFTLIELLAVIVILAIIALISTPIIISVLERARKGAFEDSAYGIISAAKLYYTNASLDNGVTNETFTFPGDTKLKISGEKPKSGSVTLDEEGNVEIAISNGKWCAKKGKEDEKVTITDYSVDDCVIPVTSETPASCFIPGYLTVEDLDINYDNCKKYIGSERICTNQSDTAVLDGYTFKEYLSIYPDMVPLMMADSIIENVRGTVDSSSIGVYICEDKNVVIPSEINGVTVKEIGASAFSIDRFFYNTTSRNLTSVVIPNTITTIGSAAFYDNQLSSLTIPDSVVSIGEMAFNRNNLPDESAFIYKRNSDGSEDNRVIVSYGGKRKSEITIPSTVTTAGPFSFAHNDIESVNKAKNLYTVEIGAFSDNKLSVIHLYQPYKIGNGAFSGNNSDMMIRIYGLDTPDWPPNSQYWGAPASNTTLDW